MQQFYSLIILSDPLNGKEITLPNKRYIIHSHPETNTDKETETREEINDINIILDIKLSDPLLKSIIFTLHENHYTVCCKTNTNELITEDINYNNPFIHHKNAYFSIKKTDNDWHENILKLSTKAIVKKEKNTISHLRKPLILIVSTFVMLFIFWLYDKNTYKNNYQTDIKSTINKFIMHNGYIQDGNNLLFIMKPNKKIPDDVYHKLKPYIVNTINNKILKISDSDITSISNKNNKVHITHISNEKKIINFDTLNIPDVFKDKISVTAFSFSEIVHLINERISNKLSNYSVEIENNKIIIYANEDKTNNVDEIISVINEKITCNENGIVVTYQKINHQKIQSGVYGTTNYRFLSDIHIDFTPEK